MYAGAGRSGGDADTSPQAYARAARRVAEDTRAQLKHAQR
jgi:hypothetical protein